MGLDISFSREKAIAAGLVTSKGTNGTPDEIERERNSTHQDPEYLKYLEKEEEFVHVPGTNMLVINDGIDGFLIRANKWGRVYEPMTKWLEANSIPWDEF
jgi:hypothetical protein